MAGKLITIAETPIFVRQSEAIWTDDERLDFVTFIAANPEAGDVVAGTAVCERSDGHAPEPESVAVVRVIYFYSSSSRPIYLLMVYAKARKEDLSSKEKSPLLELTAVLKSEKGRGHG